MMMMMRRWHWAVKRVPCPSSCDRKCAVAKWRPACGRNHDVGTRGRTQSLARLNLEHEPEVLRKVFRAETTKTAIHQHAEFEIHAFWRRQQVKLPQRSLQIAPFERYHFLLVFHVNYDSDIISGDFKRFSGRFMQHFWDNCPGKRHVCWSHRCKKTFFTFFIQGTFFTFNFFYFANVFIFKKVHWKYHLKSLSKQRKQIGSVWLFFFVPMLEFPYRPISST